MKIISWQSIFTEHEYHTWMALRDLGEDVDFVLGSLENSIRQKQGWKTLDLSNLNVKVLPKKTWWKAGTSLLQQNPTAIHVFGGFWADRRFFPLILYAALQGVKLAIINESFSEDDSGYLKDEARIISRIKVQYRPLLYRIAIKLLNVIARGNRTCFFAIGSQGQAQFSRAGFIKEQIFPFGYFVPKAVRESSILESVVSPLRIIFIGALIKRKGLDIAVEAVRILNEQRRKTDFVLDIYGPGDPSQWIPESSPGVTYKGITPFGQAQSLITNYDFLILPSRHDGWGVVVNEALLQGIPVIVSDKVGAKSLLETSGAGVVFKSGDHVDLERVLVELETNQSLQSNLRSSAENIARKILPESAAKYMQAVFIFFFYHHGERPEEIWCN